jgi:3-hydroxybutyryl-CoA dehydratase
VSGAKLPTLDDFHIGQCASLQKTIAAEDVAHFIAITGDTNPLHVDEEFASSTFFGRTVVHGLLSASIFSTMVGMILPGTGAIYRSQTLHFLAPVHVGDTLTAHFEIVSIDRESGTLEMASRIENQQGRRVIDGRASVGLIRARGELS